MTPSSINTELHALVPRLRRYARASLGDRQPADDCVARALKAVVADAVGPPFERALYRTLYRLLRTAPVAAGAGGRHDEAELVADAVRALAPLHAHVLLLRRLEGLTAEATAEVMGLSPGGVDRLLGEARTALRHRLVAGVLIVEDDFLVAEHIAAVLSELGHDVTGVVATVDQALAAARARFPDVVCADVDLGGNRSGIEVVDALRLSAPVRTIYVTAYPERVLAARPHESTFLVNKPFDDARLKTAMIAALREPIIRAAS
jgi:DNA-directed RNA polymerase specialized sigma24 family protein